MNTLEKAISSDSEDWPIFSYSQLQVWDRCEYQWYLGYEEEWSKKDRSSAMHIGSLTHKYLEIHYNHVLEHPTSTWDFVEDEIAKNIQFAVDNGSKDLTEIHRAAYMAKMYIHSFAPLNDSGIGILGVEHHFMVPYTTPTKGYKFYLQGYVDLIVSIMGKIWIMDHKTTANAAFWKPGEVQMDPQMTLYQAALKRDGMAVHGIFYNFLNSYEYKDMKKVTTEKLFRRDKSYRTDVEITNFEYQLLLEIEKLITATGDDSYQYHRSLRRDCSQCFFQEPCLHGLKGIDPQAILITKYKKKEKMPEGVRPN